VGRYELAFQGGSQFHYAAAPESRDWVLQWSRSSPWDHGRCSGLRACPGAGQSRLPHALADTDGDGTLDYLDPDDDGDGLKDLDEPPFSTDPKDSNTDGDPVNDGDEFIADTDPTDPNSFWQLTAISNVTSKTIYFESSSNRIYTLQQSVDLRDSTWATVGPEVTDVPGAGGSDSLTDTNDVEASKSYRVIVELP